MLGEIVWLTATFIFPGLGVQTSAVTRHTLKDRLFDINAGCIQNGLGFSVQTVVLSYVCSFRKINLLGLMHNYHPSVDDLLLIILLQGN